MSEQGKALQGQFVPVDTDLIIDLTENKEAAPVEVESPAVPPGALKTLLEPTALSIFCSL